MINEYIVTEKRYISWMKRMQITGIYLLYDIFVGILLLLSLSAAVYAVFDFKKNQIILPLYLTAILTCIYLLLFHIPLMAKIDYYRYSKQMGGSNWNRTVFFDENEIVVEQKKNTQHYDYRSIAKIDDRDNEVWIRFSFGDHLIVYKDCFLRGSWEDCKDLLQSKKAIK